MAKINIGLSVFDKLIIGWGIFMICICMGLAIAALICDHFGIFNK